MAEPQPANATEIEDQPPAPASAEDRKAAAALSSLSAADAPVSKSDADKDALGAAMSRLSVLEQVNKAGEVAKATGAGADKAAKKDAVKKIKVKAEDVSLLVEELELSKPKATEWLRECDADVQRAIEEWIKKGAEVV